LAALLGIGLEIVKKEIAQKRLPGGVSVWVVVSWVILEKETGKKHPGIGQF